MWLMRFIFRHTASLYPFGNDALLMTPSWTPSPGSHPRAPFRRYCVRPFGPRNLFFVRLFLFLSLSEPAIAVGDAVSVYVVFFLYGSRASVECVGSSWSEYSTDILIKPSDDVFLYNGVSKT